MEGFPTSFFCFHGLDCTDLAMTSPKLMYYYFFRDIFTARPGVLQTLCCRVIATISQEFVIKGLDKRLIF